MKVAFDSSFLTLLFNPKSGASVNRAAERVEGLIEKLSDKKDKIVIPTPALAEILVGLSRTGPTYIERLKEFSCFQVRPFDERAAVEFSVVIRSRSRSGQTRTKKAVALSKIKFDQQIVAVAKVQGVKAVYSDDKQVRSFAKECGMDAFGLADVPIPMKQEPLPFEDDDE
jgi:predicted nucleic acid-binding protein